MSEIKAPEDTSTKEERTLTWMLWVWQRVTGVTPVDRWVGRNVISALVSFTVLMLLLALSLILHDWGFTEPHRFILIITAFILMGLPLAAGIGLSIVPGDPLSFGRAFGTQENPLTRREARMETQMSIAPHLNDSPGTRERQPRIYFVTYTLQPWLLRDTTAIDRELQRLPNWSHWVNNTWLISTNEVADVLYARLQGKFLETDRLLIAPLDAQLDLAGWLPQEAWDWIESNK